MKATDLPQPRLTRFADREALSAALADHLAAALKRDLEQGGDAALAVSGGSSPAPVFEQLAASALDWSQVMVTLVDERWVAPDSPDSNEALVRRHLLQGEAAAATFLPLKNDAPDPAAAEGEVAQALAGLPKTLSAALLGMGEDGHTASFFPGAEQLGAALQPDGGAPCQAITPPVAPHPRMTLTLPRLLASRELHLLITGEAKLAVYHQALESGPVEEMPVRAVIRQRAAPLSVWWAP